MRISELSTASGISLATIKFYLREGLLPPGAATAVNKADYGAGHLHRLRLIRALTEIGGLRLHEVRGVTAAIDDDRLPLHELLGVAQYALEADDSDGEARQDPVDAATVEAVLRQLHWTVKPDAPARRALGRALASLRELGWSVSASDLARYGTAVAPLAAGEVAALPEDSRSEAVERLVSGTVLFEAILSALRRLAHEHYSGERFGSGSASTPSSDNRPRTRRSISSRIGRTSSS